MGIAFGQLSRNARKYNVNLKMKMKMKKRTIIVVITIIIVLCSSLVISIFLLKNKRSIDITNSLWDLYDSASMENYLDYHYFGIVPALENNSIIWEIDEEEYTSATQDANAYIGVTKYGNKLESNDDFYTQLYDEKYTELIDSDESFQNLDQEISEIIESEEGTFSWDERLLSSYTYGCEDCTEEEFEEMKDDIIVYLQRVFSEYKSEKVLNSGQLLKLQKSGEEYRGVMAYEGEIYEEDGFEVDIRLKDYDSFLQYDDIADLPIITFNFIGRDYSPDDNFVFSDIEKFLFSVNDENDSGKTNLIPVYVVFGNYGNESVYGMLNLIDYPKTFDTIYLGEYSAKIQSLLTVEPVTRVSFNDSYEIEGYIPNYKYLKKGSPIWGNYYHYEDLEIENFIVKVSPGSVESRYSDEIYIYLPDEYPEGIIGDSEINYDNGVFKVTINPRDFWYSYKWKTDYENDLVTSSLSNEKVLRDISDNEVEVQVCVKFKWEEFMGEEYKEEVCDETLYKYKLPIPDFVNSSI